MSYVYFSVYQRVAFQSFKYRREATYHNDLMKCRRCTRESAYYPHSLFRLNLKITNHHTILLTTS